MLIALLSFVVKMRNVPRPSRGDRILTLLVAALFPNCLVYQLPSKGVYLHSLDARLFFFLDLQEVGIREGDSGDWRNKAPVEGKALEIRCMP